MNALPLISHHLFVAAARQPNRSRRKSVPSAPPPRRPAGSGTSEPRLEVLDPDVSSLARQAGTLELAFLAGET